MKLENQVCTLEQAKELADLGVDLISQFAWCWNGNFRNEDGSEGFFLNLEGFKRVWPAAYPAFTVAELGVMLPPDHFASFIYDDVHDVECATVSYWTEQKESYSFNNAAFSTHGITEAAARAGMLIFLIKEGRVTAEEINTRLQNA